MKGWIEIRKPNRRVTSVQVANICAVEVGSGKTKIMLSGGGCIWTSEAKTVVLSKIAEAS